MAYVFGIMIIGGLIGASFGKGENIFVPAGHIGRLGWEPAHYELDYAYFALRGFAVATFIGIISMIFIDGKTKIFK